jgi:hypothetical protein
MRVNRKSVTVGLLGLGLIGAVAAGGVATAATTTPGAAPSVSSGSCTGDGQFGGRAMDGMSAPFTAAEKYLGLSQTDLQTQLQSGKALAAVAKAQGKAVTGLEDAMVAAAKVNLDTNTRLTAAEKTARLALVRSEITTMVETADAGDGMGQMGTGMDRGGMDHAGMGAGLGMGGDGTAMGGGMGM